MIPLDGKSELDVAMHGTRACRLAKMAALGLPVPEAVVLSAKDVSKIAETGAVPDVPASLLRGGFRKVFSYWVFAASQVYEFFGNFKWSGKFDPTAILAKGKSDFLAFYDGEVRAILFPSLRVEAAGMLINRRKIDVLAHIPD